MSKLQKKIIVTAGLFLLAIILFILSQIIKPDSKSESVIEPMKENLIRKSFFNNDEIAEIKFISSEIDSVLYNFGINKDWILSEIKQLSNEKKETANKTKKKADGNKFVYVPKDVSLHEILFDINSRIKIEGISFSAIEEYESGNTVLSVSGLKSPYKVNFYYDDKLKRDDNKVCLILNRLNEYKLEEVDKVLSSQFAYSVVMPVNFDRIDLQAAVIDSKRDYVLNLEIGRPEDYNSDIKKDKDWILKVYNLCTDYDKNKAIIFSNPHNAYDFEKDFIKELSKCRGYIYRDTVLTKIPADESGKIKAGRITNKLKELILMSKAHSSHTSIYLLNVMPGEFDEFINAMASLEKMGIKFMTFSEVMKKKND